MKNLLNAEETLDLVEMKSSGLGSRYIAKLLGISKSSVNNYYRLWLKSQVPIKDSLQVEYEKSINRGLYGPEYKPEDVAFKKSPLGNIPIPEAVFQESKKRTEKPSVFQYLDREVAKDMSGFYNAFEMQPPSNSESKARLALADSFDKAMDEIKAKTLVAQWKRKSLAEQKKPRILFIDLETSADIIATFGRFKINVGEKNIIQQGNQIICAAWKFSGDNSVNTSRSSFSNFKIDLQSEKYLLERIYATFKETDVVVIHNASFDLGTIQHRMLEHGMGVLPKVKVIDTLQIAKKHLKLRSNKLDSITKYFGLSNKIENSGIDLWINLQQGDEQAMQTMLDYNIGDITALEAVYNKFVPLNQGTSLAPMMSLDHKHCTSCGSIHVHPTGRTISTSLSMFSEYECNDCGAKMRDRVNTLSKEQRSNLLMPL